MRILIAGATSGFGRNAVQYLLQPGELVVAIRRNCEVGRNLINAGAQFVALGLTEASEGGYVRLMDGCGAVWHCVAKSSPWGDKTAFWFANVKVTHTLAQVADRLNIPWFIHIFTPAIYLDFQYRNNLPETYLARAFSSHYANSGHAAEQVIAGAVSRYSATRFIFLCLRGSSGPHNQVITPRLM